MTFRFGSYRNPGSDEQLGVEVVAKQFGVTAKVIWEWVKLGQFIKPVKRSSSRRSVSAFWTTADIEKEKLKRGIK